MINEQQRLEGFSKDLQIIQEKWGIVTIKGKSKALAPLVDGDGNVVFRTESIPNALSLELDPNWRGIEIPVEKPAQADLPAPNGAKQKAEA